jgi:hypothetical protein
VLDFIRELDSDFSVYHRIDDFLELGAYQFWSRAWMLDRYGGAVTNRRLAERETSVAAPTKTSAPDRRSDGIPVVGSEEEARALSLRRFTTQHSHMAAEGVESISDDEMIRQSGFGG